MNKLVKGSIAGGLGVVLLLGGAGTLALWNQTATVAGGNVTAGVLTIDGNTATAGTWTDISPEALAINAAGVAIPDIANYKIVPGDKIKFTKTVSISATGDHLKGKLTYDDATIVAPTGANAAVNQALKSRLVTTLAASAGAGVGVSQIGTTNEFNVTPTATTTATTVTLALTISLPATVGNADVVGDTGTIAQNGVVNLSNLAFKLTQVRP